MNDKLGTANNLTDQTRQDIISKFTEMESYFNVVNQTIATKQLYEDTGFDIDEVHHKFDAFKVTVNLLFNTPSPKPKKEGEQKQEDQSNK